MDEIEKVLEESCYKHNLQYCKNFTYSGVKTLIETKCNECQYSFTRTFFSFKYDDHGCPNCSEKTPYDSKNICSRVYAKRPIHESNIVIHKIPLDFSKGNKTKLDLLCLSCSYQWNTCSINSYCSKKYGCPRCNKRVRYTNKSIHDIIEYSNLNSTESTLKIIDINEISGNSTRVLVQCKKCSHEWKKEVRHIIANRSSCPICAKNYKFTEENVIQRIYSIKDPEITNIVCTKIPKNPKYNTYLDLKCIKCNNEWSTTTISSYIYNNIRCGICSKNKSLPVLEMEKILSENGIEFIMEHRFPDCKNINPLPFDFYIPEVGVCIEYDGIQHYKSIEHWGGQQALDYRKANDKIKDKYCLDAGIKLYRISYRTDHVLEIKNLIKELKR